MATGIQITLLYKCIATTAAAIARDFNENECVMHGGCRTEIPHFIDRKMEVRWQMRNERHKKRYRASHLNLQIIN